ncbi:isochorismate synthase DhbC [Bacillus velezensis]|uniref:isochorismate synthase DhbC n=1 Tax=Bacillus velezensis TaxID=492670 RepID=UPI002DBFDDDE|nr:isochorismate synthase DhbC [Bacillus velezensis]MEC3848568.1 isochorismate synthase DhbC [Bacillus velezensis]
MTNQHVLTEVSAKEVLDAYKPGAFFLASPKSTLLAEGVFAKVPDADAENQLDSLPERVRQTLLEAKQAGIKHPIAAGAIPFDGRKASRLFVPKIVHTAGPLSFAESSAEKPQSNTYDIRPVPEPEGFMSGVEQGVFNITDGPLSKIVLSRTLHLTAEKDIDIPQAVKHLAQHNPRGYTFAADVTGTSETRKTLFGASPELLLSKNGTSILSNPLAGSRPRSADPAEDQRRAEELLQSAKDLHEHAVVVAAVAAALKPFCRVLDVPEKPSLIKTEAMWHLSTEVKGELSDPSTTSLELAIALHPTPAVCGTPTDAAREAIQDIEPFDRNFYTGMAGWCDAEGDGEWIIALRCAEAETRSLRLFAGAGIVAGSKPQDELDETSAKFRTMLRAMGLYQDEL